MSLENTFVLSAHGRIIDEIITVPSNTYLFFLSDKKDYCYSDQDKMFIKCICKWITKIREHDKPEELEKKKYYQFILKLFLFKSERDKFLEHLIAFQSTDIKYVTFLKFLNEDEKTQLSEIDIFLFNMILKLDDNCDNDENESIKNIKRLQSKKKFDKIEKRINKTISFLISFWNKFSISEIALPNQSILNMNLVFFTRYKNINTDVTIFKSGSIQIDNYIKPEDNYSFTFKHKNPKKYLDSLLANFGKMKLNDIIQKNESGFFFKQHSKEEIKSIMESKPDKSTGFTEQKKVNMVLPSMVLNAMEHDTSRVKTDINYKINQIVDLCNREPEKCSLTSTYFNNKLFSTIFDYKLSQVLESNKIYFVSACRVMSSKLKEKEDKGENPPEHVPTFEEINSKHDDDVFKQFIKSFLS